MSIIKLRSSSLQLKHLRFMSVFLVLLSLQMLSIPLFAHASNSVGHWNQVQIVPKASTYKGDGYSRNGTVSDGSASYNFSTDNGKNIFKTSASWSGIKSSYSANEEIEVILNLKIDNYVNGGSWNFVKDYIGAQFDAEGLRPGSGTNSIKYLCDKTGGHSFVCNGEYGKVIVPAVTKTVRATFGAGSSGHSRTSLYVATSAGCVEYIYEWQENGAATKPSPSPTPAAKPSPSPKPSFAPIPDDSGVRFSSLNGQVDIKYPGKERFQAAELGRPIPIGSIIETMEESSAILSFSDMSTYVLKAENIVVVGAPPERDGKLKILMGNIWINIKKMLKDGSMEVETNQAVCGIRGTIFVVETNDSITTLKVLEGKVAFTSKASGNTVEVTAGERVSADASGLSKVTAFDIAKEEANWREFDLPSVAAAPHSAVAHSPAPRSPALIIILSLAVLAVIIIIVSILLSRRAGKRRRMHMPAQMISNAYSPPYNAPGVQPVQSNAGAFCSNCGTSLGAADRFCAKCGYTRAR